MTEVPAARGREAGGLDPHSSQALRATVSVLSDLLRVERGAGLRGDWERGDETQGKQLYMYIRGHSSGSEEALHKIRKRCKEPKRSISIVINCHF